MRRLLIVRTDAIGDAILWNGALPGLRRAFPHARIAIACRDAVAPIYETAPEIDEIFPLDMAAIARDPGSAETPAAALSAWNADLLLHPTRSREKHTEGLIARVRAGSKAALESDLANCTPEERAAFDAEYDRIIRTSAHDACELERHVDVLRFFGNDATVRPRVILTDTDRGQAGAMLRGIDEYAVLSPSARWPIKHYPSWAEAITTAWAGTTHPRTLVAVGGADASPPAATIFAELARTLPNLRAADLTGAASLRVACAVVGGARLCIGNDTFTAHAAAALGVPSATVVGGGHFGRFLPYDPTSVVAAMPLSCDGCDWRCRYERPYCIKDVPVRLVAHAIRLATTRNQGRPRVVTPETAADFGPAGPASANLPRWLADRIEPTISGRPRRQTRLVS